VEGPIVAIIFVRAFLFIKAVIVFAKYLLVSILNMLIYSKKYMRKYIYSILLYILVFISVSGFFSGIKFPDDIIYHLMVLGGLSFGLLIGRPLLRFLTVSRNFLTLWFAFSLLILGIMYAFDIFIPGFTVVSSNFKKISSDMISIASFSLNSIMTMIFYALTSGMMCALMDTLNKTRDFGE